MKSNDDDYLPSGWETWTEEGKEKYLDYLEQEEYRLGLKERPWRKLARNKQLPPDAPNHHLGWKHPQTGEIYYCKDPRCQAGEVDDDWATWLWMAARGTGKRLDVDTPIPVPGGWKRLGDLNVGDHVFDHAGRPTRVLAVYDGTPNVAYRLTFADGSILDADAEHLWTTWTHRDRAQYLRAGNNSFDADWPAWRSAHGRGPKVRTSKEIVSTLGTGIRADTNHCVPVCGALQLPEAELPVDPYVFGCWLGDGTTVRAEITISDDDAEEMLGYLTERGAPPTVAVRRPGALCATYRIGDGGRFYDHESNRFASTNKIANGLRELGVLGGKRLPVLYLRASAAQRLELLKGLMDTDGGWSRGTVEFCNTDHDLACAVAELACSLGQKATIHEGRATIYGRDCGPKYRVTWTPTINVFRLTRKAGRFTADHPQMLRNHHRMIKSAEEITPKPMRCITVESEHGLFLAGPTMIPTHNTWVGANWVLEMALNNPGIEVGVCGPDYGHVRRICFEDTKSGILRQARNAGYPAEEYYNRNNLEITFPNTSVIKGMSAEKEDSPRGSNLSFCWFDELCQIKNEMFYHDSLMPALREDDARLLITTTPNRTRIIRDLVENAKDPAYRIHITGAPTRENPKFATHRRQMLENQYAGTLLYKQEMEGELLADVAGALFTLDRISGSRVGPGDIPENRPSTVVAIDPANTSHERSDETGIVCAVQGDDGHAYIVADRSMRGSPEECMRAAVALYQEWNADMIVCEKNNVGDYLDEALRHVNPNISLRKIHARKGKYLRAQPVSMLMDQGRIHHVGVFDKLEDQLCSVTADSDRSVVHDDRADAYVYAITALKLSDISWAEVYGMRTCDCGYSFPEVYESCRSCGKGFPKVEKKEEEKPKGDPKSWASAYVKRCPDCNDIYDRHLPKCPACHPDPNVYVEQVLRLTGRSMGGLGVKTQGLRDIWKRGNYR